MNSVWSKGDRQASIDGLVTARLTQISIEASGGGVGERGPPPPRADSDPLFLVSGLL